MSQQGCNSETPAWQRLEENFFAKLVANAKSPMEVALACAQIASSRRTMDDKLNPTVAKIVQDIDKFAALLPAENYTPSEIQQAFWAAEGGWSYEGWTLIGVYPSKEAAEAATKGEESSGYGRTRVTECKLGERVDGN